MNMVARTLLCYFHWSAEPWPHSSPSVENAITLLQANGLITNSDIAGVYKTTARGACFVEHIRNLPLPNPTWTMESRQ